MNASNICVPVKGGNDKRNYRFVTLNNGLRCFLVSDEETDKVTCILDAVVVPLSFSYSLDIFRHFF